VDHAKRTVSGYGRRLKTNQYHKGCIQRNPFSTEIKVNGYKLRYWSNRWFFATKAFVRITPNLLTRLILGSIAGMATASNGSKAVSGIKTMGNNILRKLLR
jgi:hypothetical protein